MFMINIYKKYNEACKYLDLEILHILQTLNYITIF